MIAAVVISAGILLAQPVTTPADTACGAMAGAAGLLERAEGRVLLLGERHGTREAPAVAGQLACLALNQGESVVLAMEISAAEQERLDVYIGSDGSMAARRTLFEGSSFWDGEIHDGRSSTAWLQLVDAVRIWSGRGSPIRLVAVDRGPDDAGVPGPQPRDRVMARNLEALHGGESRVIFLSGNIHARRTQMRYGERVLETVGTYMPPDTYYTVNLIGDGGESWVCIGTSMEDVECGPRPLAEIDLSGEPRPLAEEELVAIPHLAALLEAYHEIVYLGPVSTAEPAIEQLATD